MNVIDLDKLSFYLTQYESKFKESTKSTETISKGKKTNQDTNSKNKKGEKLRSNDFELINKNALLTLAGRINREYLTTIDIITHKLPLTDIFDDQLKFNQLDDKLDWITSLIKMPRDATLLILKSVNTKKPIPCNEDIQVDPAEVPVKINNPPLFNFGNLIWKDGANIPESKFRYIHNFEIKNAIKKISNISDLSTRSTKMEAKMVSYFINKVLNQTRSVNISRMSIISLLLLFVIPSNNMSLHHCIKEQNPGLYYLQQLMKNYVRWPFLDSSSGMYYPNDDIMSSQLPLLIYSVLNRMVSYSLGAITIGYFNLSMNVFFEWSIDSLDDNHLNYKGDMNKVTKLLNERVDTNEKILNFDSSGIMGVRQLDNNLEFWLSGEKDSLIKILNESVNNRPYFNVVSELLKRTFSRDDLILHKLALECCTNNTTFKKSSPILEYDRSAEHKVYTPVALKHAKVSYNGFIIEPRYSGTLGKCWDKIMSYNGVIQEKLKNRNLEAEFFDRLSNNSSGIVSDTVISKKRDDVLLKALPTIPYGQRYVTALLENDILYNKEKALDSITQRVRAGKREQNDRRSRWIMMVLNILQSVFSVALTYGREFAKHSKFIASGKQIGNIKDMVQVLRSSSEAHSVNTDNDIKGMDSSTQEQVANLVLTAVWKSLEGLDIKNFFYASNEIILCDVHDDFGNIVSKVKYEANAAQVFIMDIVSKMRQNSFEFTEEWLVEIVNISGSVFWSGAFHTAVQHNTFLSSLLDVLVDHVNASLSIYQVSIEGLVLGDDVTLEIKNNETNKGSDHRSATIIQELIKLLNDAGFEAEPESSRFSATFLQQTGLFGGCKPKHARLSLITAEQDTNRTKDPTEQIKEIGDILDELSARSPSPSSAIPIFNSFWAVARHLTLKQGLDNDSFSNRIDKMGLALLKEDNAYNRWIGISPLNKNSIWITIPFVAVYLPEVFGSTPMPMFFRSKGEVMYPSYFAPKGSFSYWYLFKALEKKMSAEEIIAETKNHKESYIRAVKEKIAKGYVSETKLSQIDSMEWFVNPKSKIDQRLAFKLGLSFSQWLIPKIAKRYRLTEEEESSPVFSKLVAIGQSKQDSLKVAASNFSISRLSKERYFMPESLKYTSQPENRIKQAFILKKTKSKKNGSSNKKLIDSIYSLLIRSEEIEFTIKDVALSDYDVILSNTKLELAPEASLLNIASLGGCCKIGSESHSLCLLFGTPLTTEGRESLSESFRNEMSFGADVDLVMKEAMKIMKIKESLIYDFLTAIGIDSRSHERLVKMIRDYIQVGNVSTQSIFNVRKYFYHSTNPSIVSRLGMISYSSIIGIRWSRMQAVLIRDYLFAFPSTSKKVIIKPTPALFNRLVRPE
uniref:RNA-dependent RNA polymerase n=1 Tax=Hubei reo-like virus 2 TaxID=1923177 RepID=A0A1L3KP27_9VIRU|nr:RNA-dependent RNA polymerase [Hubei reo-like virus 2]